MRGVFKSIQTADGKYMVGLNDELYKNIIDHIELKNIGSYNILGARLLGLNYADYLRYGRDKYRGTIKGKGHKYPILQFNDLSDCNKLCKELTLIWMNL